ncbi:MAG: hypothetical protein ACT4PP_00985 [Sporichthyaceae bacterium]
MNMIDTQIWVRARATMSGERWFRCTANSAAAAELAPGVAALVDRLDPAGISVLVAPVANSESGWAVVARGLPTAQKMANTAAPVAALVVLTDERACRNLAAALLAGLSGPENNLAVALGGCVHDGPDTVSIALRSEFTHLLDAALRDVPVLRAGARSESGTAGQVAATAALLAGDGPLPTAEIPVLVSASAEPMAAGPLAGVGLHVDTRPAAPIRDPGATLIPGPEDAEPAVAAAERVLSDRPARSARLVSAVVNVVSLVALVFLLGSAVIAVRAGVDLAETGRRAFGLQAPSEGVDWYLLSVGAVFLAVPLAALAWLARLLRRRYRSRLQECFGDTGDARVFTGHVKGSQTAWLREVLESARWSPSADEWRLGGQLPPGRLDDAQYRAAAALVRGELNNKLGAVALATGLAVAVAQRPIADAAAVVAGSAELQIEALATLGLRPTPRAWLHIGRAASTALLAASYLDAEERLEVRLMVRAAAAGIDTAEGLVEDLDSALGEAAEGIGGTVGAGLQLLTGATAGVTGTVLRQTSEFIKDVGDEISEGLIVATVLHFHAMALVADALALDEAHRRELALPAGRVPPELLRIAGSLARRQTLAFSRMLRGRARASLKAAPKSLLRRKPKT